MEKLSLSTYSNNELSVEFDNQYNPTVYSPTAPYGISFRQTKESMQDVEVYKNFLENAISQFRHMAFYKEYKSYLIGLGLDHCQVMSGITSENVGANGIEMNHNFLTIFDIALLITEHILNTVGSICTFELIHELRIAHQNNLVPIVMLSETVHQMYHNNDDLYFPSQMCFGYWVDLLQKYNRGITPSIADKVIRYINRSVNEYKDNSMVINYLLSTRKYVKDWSEYNDYNDYNYRAIGNVGIGQYDYPDTV